MSLSLGIVGLPNVGKSTLFNALTRNNVVAANYPFATIEPNEGVVSLPDPRLDKLAELFDSERIVAAPVTFVDIAGLVKGASEGAGLGNKFLAHIRECDAICQVVRVFSDDDVTHVSGEVDPEVRHRDRRDRADPGRHADPGARAAPAGEGSPHQQGTQGRSTTPRWPPNRCWTAGRRCSPRALDVSVLRELNLLTTKPFLYVFNADEGC